MNGQFVTLWKRIEKGPIMPHYVNDSLDLVIVCVRDGDRYGQFVFSALDNEDAPSQVERVADKLSGSTHLG